MKKDMKMIAFITATSRGKIIKFRAASWGHARDLAVDLAGVYYRYLAIDFNPES